MEKKKITIIYTGGTISMAKAGPDGGVVPSLTGKDIARFVPGLKDSFDLVHVDFGQLPSPHMTTDRMTALVEQIEAAVLDDSTGVVVTHGTDTLEESAFFVDLAVRTSAPIVFVGAMRTSDELSWDGPINLASGCFVASSDDARGKGVMVVMNNTINAASEVTKSFTEAVDTFVSPDFGPLGVVESEQVFIYRQPVRRMRLDRFNGFKRVDVITAYAGADATLVKAAIDAGAEGLVIEAMGRGNIPPAMAELVTLTASQGMPIVITSRCWGGRVSPVYGYEGGGRRLLEAGCIFAPWYSPSKARIALGMAIAAEASREALRDLFDSPELESSLPIERRPEEDSIPPQEIEIQDVEVLDAVNPLGDV